MIWPAFKLSLLVTLVATSVVVLLGTAFAFLLAKRKFRGRELLDAVVTLPLVLPPTVTGYYLIVLLGRRGIIGSYIYEYTGWSVTFTWWAAVIAAAVMALPLMVKSARAAIESVNPQYEIASYTLGKSELETFFRITLPLASRGIFAGIVLSFARALGEFGATLMLAGNIPGKTQTMPLAIYEAVVAGESRQAQILALILTAVSVTAIYLTNGQARWRYKLLTIPFTNTYIYCSLLPMKLSKWAKQQGVSYMTAWRWFRDGKLPVEAEQMATGTIIVKEAIGTNYVGVGLYARVSSAEQKPELDKQIARLLEFAGRKKLAVIQSVTEIGSAMNGHRPKLLKLLRDPLVKIILVEHRDSLIRFGFDYLEASLSAQGRRIIVVDNTELKEDLVRDMTEVLTSFCARLYGRRAANNKAKKALRALDDEN